VQRPILLAQAAVARGNYGAAVAELQRAVARKPRDPGVRMALAQTLVQAKRWSEAAALYRDLLRERPNDSVLLSDSLQLAAALMEAKRWDESEALYRQLLLTQPNDPGLLNNLAYLYADGPKTHMDEALQMAQRATNLAPQVGTFWDTLAWVYFQRRQWEDAYRAQREAVLLVPDEHVVRYHMGAIQEARGETAAAREEYRQALKLEPTFAPARAALRRLEPAPAPARATGAALAPRPADMPAA
jgi:Flp pilus assembly protein TadD